MQFSHSSLGHGCSTAPACGVCVRVWNRGRKAVARLGGGAAAARPGAKGLSAATAPSAAGCKQRSLSLSCLAAARSRSPEPGAVTWYAPDRCNLAAPGSAPHGHSEGAPRQGGWAAAAAAAGAGGRSAAPRAAARGGRVARRRRPRGSPRCCRNGRRLRAG